MLSQRPLRKSDSGFTFIELLVVIIIIAVLAAIAAPGWIAFMNRQRVNTVRNETLQIIRTAQTQARRTRSNQVVQFDINGPRPRVALNGVWQNLGSGEIRPGVMTMSTKAGTQANVAQITFNHAGGLDPAQVPFQVTFSVANSTAKRCLRVESILGATRPAEGAACD
jgi:prepilin-type N-terminal cleavage/methylation domain-containing protein